MSIANLSSNVYGIGIITDTHLYVCNWKGHESIPANRQVRKIELPHEMGTALAFGNMCELAIKHDLQDLWVCPGSKISESIGENPELYVFPSDDVFDRRHYTEDHGIPRSVIISQKQGSFADKRRVYIYLPEHDVRWLTDDKSWCLADVEEPYVLLGGLCYLWEAGIIIRNSPGYSGVELMKKTADSVKAAKGDISGFPDSHLEGDILSARPLTDVERAMGYVHFFDRNSQRLAAATGLEVGIGNPDHVILSSHGNQPNLKLTGIWKVRVKSSPDTAALFPSPLTGEWTTNEVCNQMVRMGYVLEYLEGHLWNEKLDPKSGKSKRMQTRLLEPWAKLLWDTRRALKEDRTRYPNQQAAHVAYMMIKFVATRAVGWLDLGRDKEKPYSERGQWNRPDIANGIIGLARARMLLKMQEIFTDHGIAPIAVRTDMLVYCSNDPNPLTAFPKLTVRKDELGGFKVVGTLPMSEGIIQLLATDGTDLNKLNGLKTMLSEVI